MSGMEELAGRVESATGPDWELDALIAPILGLRVVDEGHPLGRCCYDRNGISILVPAYTASLDAAMTLADGFVLLNLSDIGADGLPLCRLGDPGTIPCGEWIGIAPTLPRSVTAAALRARASLLSKDVD